MFRRPAPSFSFGVFSVFRGQFGIECILTKNGRHARVRGAAVERIRRFRFSLRGAGHAGGLGSHPAGDLGDAPFLGQGFEDFRRFVADDIPAFGHRSDESPEDRESAESKVGAAIIDADLGVSSVYCFVFDVILYAQLAIHSSGDNSDYFLGHMRRYLSLRGCCATSWWATSAIGRGRGGASAGRAAAACRGITRKSLVRASWESPARSSA